jgi:hypothetical protein
MHVPQSRDHKLAGAIDHLSGGRYRDLFRSADSGNVVSADEDSHVLLWLTNTWIDDGDMRERKAARLRKNYPRKPQQCAKHG